MPSSPATNTRAPVWSLALGMLLVASRPAQAHDYWLEVQPATPAPGADMAVALWLGHAFLP